MQDPDAKDGVWFVFAYDIGPYPIGMHKDELGARRMVEKLGYFAHVVFWPSGKYWEEINPHTS